MLYFVVVCCIIVLLYYCIYSPRHRVHHVKDRQPEEQLQQHCAENSECIGNNFARFLHKYLQSRYPVLQCAIVQHSHEVSTANKFCTRVNQCAQLSPEATCPRALKKVKTEEGR